MLRYVVAVVSVVSAAVGLSAAAASASTPPSAPDAPSGDPAVSVALTEPAEYAHVAGAVPLAMSATGIAIEPAGESHDGAGHFHIIADAGCLPTGESIVKDADHVHFGNGQAEGLIYLEPGRHTLCLQVGDGIHLALDVTDTVTIDVGIDSTDEWCSVLGQVDGLFAAADESDDDFPVEQLGYENIRRLVVQLQDGLEYVDAGARSDLDATLEFVAGLVEAIVAAPDETAAEADVGAVYATAPSEGSLPGGGWVSERCGVDIDD